VNSAPPRLDVNILPHSYRRRRLERNQILLLAALVVVIVLAFLFYRQVSVTVRQSSDLRSELAALNLQLDLRRTKISARTEMVSLTLEYESIVAKRSVISDDVKAVAAAAEGVGIKTSSSTQTPRIQVTSVSHAGGNVDVSCAVIGYHNDSYEAVGKLLDDFCAALEQNERFDSAEYDDLNVPLPSSVDVEITVGSGAG